jgi:hypothetical protein
LRSTASASTSIRISLAKPVQADLRSPPPPFWTGPVIAAA